MNYPKQKPENEQDEQKANKGEANIDITQLTGSPEAGGVSKVAMGQKADTQYTENDVYDAGWIERLKGKKTSADCGCEGECEHKGIETTSDDINEAYAKLFEGLAGIARAK